VGDVLVYQTSDEAFVGRAMSALEEAGIRCCRTGYGWSFPPAGSRRLFNNGVSIVVQQESDYQRANQIIVALGGYVERPIRPIRLIEIGLALAVLATILVVTFNL